MEFKPGIYQFLIPTTTIDRILGTTTNTRRSHNLKTHSTSQFTVHTIKLSHERLILGGGKNLVWMSGRFPANMPNILCGSMKHCFRLDISGWPIVMFWLDYSISSSKFCCISHISNLCFRMPCVTPVPMRDYFEFILREKIRPNSSEMVICIEYGFAHGVAVQFGRMKCAIPFQASNRYALTLQ